jgi:hypothetical protein
MTNIVVVEVQASGTAPIASQPANGDPSWLDRLMNRAVDYFADVSGGREQLVWRYPSQPGVLFSNHLVTLDLSDLADVSTLTSEQLVTRTRAALVASGEALQPDDHLLVLKNFSPPVWAGSTESDPTVSVDNLNANAVCHEIGHLLQRLRSGTSQHACTIAEEVVDQYLDATCLMGGQGNYHHEDAVVRAMLPPQPPERYDSLVPPAVNPAMANLCGWFANQSPATLRDISGAFGSVFSLAPWRGSPAPGYEGPPRALFADGVAPTGHRVYVTWRVNDGWDSGFPRADTIAVYEEVSRGPSLLLAEFEPVIGASRLVDRCGLLITPQRLTKVADHELIELRIERELWLPDDILQGASFDPASRIAALARSDLMEVFVVSADPADRRVREKLFMANMWQPGWITLDGGVASGPRAGLAVTSRSPDNIMLFVTGDPDGANGAQIRVRELNGQAWGPWDTITVGGLTESSQLAGVALDRDRVELFAVDRWGRVLRNTLDRDRWGSWTPLPAREEGGHRHLFFGSVAAQVADDGYVRVHAVAIEAEDEQGRRTALPATTVWAYSLRQAYDGVWREHNIGGDASLQISPGQGVAVARVHDNLHEVVAAHDPLLVHTYDTDLLTGKWTRIAPDRAPGQPSPIGPEGCVAAVSRDRRSLDIFFVDNAGRVRHKLRRDNPDLSTANVQVDSERRVCIQLQNSPFHVSAENGGGAGVRVDRIAVLEWERFTLQQFATQTVDGGAELPVFALRAYNGQYLCAEQQGGGGMHLTADRWAVGDWEKFRLEPVDGQPWVGGIQTQAGWYWCAEDGGGSGVAPNRSDRGPWETFQVLPA